jgi:hypothetical protein
VRGGGDELVFLEGCLGLLVHGLWSSFVPGRNLLASQSCSRAGPIFGLIFCASRSSARAELAPGLAPTGLQDLRRARRSGRAGLRRNQPSLSARPRQMLDCAQDSINEQDVLEN